MQCYCTALPPGWPGPSGPAVAPAASLPTSGSAGPTVPPAASLPTSGSAGTTPSPGNYITEPLLVTSLQACQQTIDFQLIPPPHTHSTLCLGTPHLSNCPPPPLTHTVPCAWVPPISAIDPPPHTHTQYPVPGYPPPQQQPAGYPPPQAGYPPQQQQPPPEHQLPYGYKVTDAFQAGNVVQLISRPTGLPLQVLRGFFTSTAGQLGTTDSEWFSISCY